MQNLEQIKQTAMTGLKSLISSEKNHYNLKPAELVELALLRKEGKLTSNGSLMVDTGTFTGRSPKDRYIVLDDTTRDAVWWGDINIPFDSEKFDALYEKMVDNISKKEIFIRDAYAGADTNHKLSIRVYNSLAWHNLFCHNMFIRPTEDELKEFTPDFTIICDPEFEADPSVDGTSNGNFAILNLSKKIILIGGTAYAGEMKKGIFSVLNFILPHEKNILSMHCSANISKDGDTAIFFGLSGTGKTTLSTDPNRALIGDDEHAWTEDTVFNFEGGCYAKVIDLDADKEPEIWNAIQFGTIVENTVFYENSREVNYQDISLTQNTRAAYPIHFIKNSVKPSIGSVPKNIFFLTADAFGVIPPISKLSKEQAMYHFISGYTAKVAGTEMGVTEPKLTFSACFGAAFLPLHPSEYATLLGEKMEKHDTNVWLINTGWTGGPYGVGSRMKLKYTRAMITAALEGSLNNVAYKEHEIFGFQVPQECPNVDNALLNPRDTWSSGEEYDVQAKTLANAFRENFKKFEESTPENILKGGPIK